MHFKEELSYKEIAEKLNISCENVRKRISQARKILQQRYDQDFLGDDHSKSGVVSQCELRNTSVPIQQIEVNQIEVTNIEITQNTTKVGVIHELSLHNNLEVANLELFHQETSRNQINIIANEQFNITDEEVGQKSYVNVNDLPLLKVLNYWEIGENRLLNFGEWLNFDIIQYLHLKRINVLWQILADSGGI